MNPLSPFNPLDAPIPDPNQTGRKAPLSSMGTVALQGDIAAIALENIFQLFDFAALTGKLEIRTNENSGSFYFKKGMLTYGILHINHRRIGELLLDSQMITANQLEECLLLHQQDSAQKRFGQILLDKGYIQPGNLDESLLRQIKEAFFVALSWQQGTFHFYLNQHPAPEELQTYTRIDHLLLEGVVYLDNTASPAP